jgi:hypothetical protein
VPAEVGGDVGVGRELRWCDAPDSWCWGVAVDPCRWRVLLVGAGVDPEPHAARLIAAIVLTATDLPSLRIAVKNLHI